MNHPKKQVLFLLILAFSISACKKKKSIQKIIQPIDIQINRDQGIKYNDLTIYPITQSNKSIDTNLLTLQELTQITGFNTKNHIVGNGVITNAFGPLDEFFLANKTKKAGITLLGEIIYDDNENISFLTEGAYLPAKKITQTWIATINSTSFRGQNKSTNYLFPCPPTALKYILNNNIWEAAQWLRIALPKIHSTYKKNENTYSIQKRADNEDNFDEVFDDNGHEHEPMENLGSLSDFMQAFTPLTRNTNTAGCLITYQDKILISYFFDNPNIFRKEWPFLIKSLYLNQLMGHSELDLQELSPFDETKAVQNQINNLWIKKNITPEDNAFRGEQDGIPYYLVVL